MNKILFLLGATFFIFNSYSQSNLIVFSEDGDAFTMTVDGSPATNLNDSKVVYDGIKGDFVQAKISFIDPVLGEIKKGLMIEPNMEITAVLKKNKKGAFVLRPMSSVPVASAPARDLPPPVLIEETTVVDEEVAISSGNETTISTTTTESTSSSINVGVNDPEMGVNMNVNINLNDIGGKISSKFTEITTTTTKSSTISSNNNVQTEESAPIEEVEVICSPMSNSDFERAKKSVSGKSFAEDKMTLAKQILKSNCVSTDQVIEMMGLFTFEENKLEFAKMAFERTTDTQNYYRVNDAFTYSGSIDELNEFIESF